MVVLVEISGKRLDFPHLKFQGKLFFELPEADASSTLLVEDKRRNLRFI
jgi:hypothetical protein